MPVSYIPQFIPTNAQALQGVLSEYQQAYDQNLARELEIQDQYSMIPTITAEDTQRKNEILGSFANTMTDLEKKYNYDRASSSYAKELARKISELRKNDFWAYNERKKELVKAAEEDKRRIGAGYYSVYDPVKATYEDQTALNNYRPIDTKDIFTIGRTIAEEYSNANPKTSEKNLIDPRTNQIYGIEYQTQLGFLDPNEMNAFLSGKEGQDMVSQALKTAGIPEDLLNDPTLRSVAIGGLQSGLVGKMSQDRLRLPDIDTGRGRETKVPQPWVPIGTITIDDGIKTPEKLKNTRQGEKTQDYETSQYYDAVKKDVLNNEKNIEIINRGRVTLAQAAQGLPQSAQDDLFNNLIDLYLTQGTGNLKEFFSLSGKSVSARTFIFDYLKSKNISNPGKLADKISESMNSWYNADFSNVKKDISSQLNKGLTREYAILVPPIQPKADTEKVVDFVENIINQYAVSTPEGESDIIDEKDLTKFKEAEGDLTIAMLQSPGKIPILRLVKGDVKSGAVLDVTMNPAVSGYAAWAQLAAATNTPSLLSDAYFSNIHMIPEVEYSVGKTSQVPTDVQNTYTKYIKDMIKSDPKYANKSDEELSNIISEGLKGISWKEDVDSYGQSTFRIYREGVEIPIDNAITSVDELMYRLSNLAKV